MNAEELYRRLDALYAADDAKGAYRLLCEQKSEAERTGDDTLALAAANSLMGHCRENCLFDEVDGHYREALRCIDALGLRGTLDEAATLLNAATVFCVMGRQEQSEELYDRAERLYLRLSEPGDARVAAIYNNKGLLFRSRGEREKAYASFAKALALLTERNGPADELAASRLNLASVCGELSEAEELAGLAAAYYDTPEGRTDIHRFTAAALQAELAYRRGEYARAGELFEKTADEWISAGGAKQRTAVLLRNALHCCEKAAASAD
ncbi:MAG: tetratricopeptide repeat protein, partial [Oscillospiraceae bacterium]|nr:tetratricopeptide repeat protein [Oscillospiraceae bacterium]